MTASMSRGVRSAALTAPARHATIVHAAKQPRSLFRSSATSAIVHQIATRPLLSPTLSSVLPKRSATLSQRLATGVQSPATRWRSPLILPPAPSDRDEREGIGRVRLAVAHSAAVEDQRVVEDRALAFGHGAQLLQEVREEAREVSADLGVQLHVLGTVAMVRHVVVRLPDLEQRVGPLAGFTRHHEREHARRVSLIRHGQQVEHQRCVVFEHLRDAEGRVECDDARAVLRLGPLDAPFDLAHVIQVVGEASAVLRADATLNLLRFLADRIEDASVFLYPRHDARRRSRPCRISARTPCED